MKNKIVKLFVMLAIILPTCINFVSCDYGTYNIYPESTNESGTDNESESGTDNEPVNGTDNESVNGANDENANSSGEKSSEMLNLFKTSINIGRPLKLKIKISAEKTTPSVPLDYYPISSDQSSSTAYCNENFSVINPPMIYFGGEGKPAPWNTSDAPVTFKIKIESDIPPLDDLPIYFGDQLLGNLKGFTREAEFTINGSVRFLFNNYLSASYTYVDSYEETIHHQADVGGPGGDDEIKNHRHTINLSGTIVNAQSPERIDVYLSGKNILEDFPLIIGESNIPLENVSLKFSFKTSVSFSGNVSVSNTNSCCYRALSDEGGSGMPSGTTYSTQSGSAKASWDFFCETARDPILLAPISIFIEEESTELPGINTETNTVTGNNSPTA